MPTVTELRAAVERRLDEAGRAWLDGALTDAAESGPRQGDAGLPPGGSGPARWELDFASAGRRVRSPRPAADRPAADDLA
ncbi:hypothetical protein JBE04_40515, partial [Streptomyces sp. PRKS01-29]|nr:hypothetical protein [Streptomyces sabulosicollis]